MHRAECNKEHGSPPVATGQRIRHAWIGGAGDYSRTERVASSLNSANSERPSGNVARHIIWSQRCLLEPRSSNAQPAKKIRSAPAVTISALRFCSSGRGSDDDTAHAKLRVAARRSSLTTDNARLRAVLTPTVHAADMVTVFLKHCECVGVQYTRCFTSAMRPSARNTLKNS